MRGSSFCPLASRQTPEMGGFSRPILRSSQFLPRLNLGNKFGGSTHSKHRGLQPRRGLKNNAQQQRGGGGPVASSAASWWASSFTLSTAAAALIGGGLTLAITQTQQYYATQQLKENETALHSSPSSTSRKNSKRKSSALPPAWTVEVNQEPGAIKVLDAEILLKQDHPFLEDDHMFAAFVSRGIINDLQVRERENAVITNCTPTY